MIKEINLKFKIKENPHGIISNALDGSEDDILYEESDASSKKTTMKMILVAVTTIFWVAMMNKLYYGC